MKDSGIQPRDEDGKKWRLRVDIGKDASGQRKRYTEVFSGGIVEARKRMRELRSGVDKGTFVAPSRTTVAEHLNDWLNGYVKTNCSPRTLEGYKSICDHHLAPAFGGLQLKQLTPKVIQEYYGKACGAHSARTVQHWHRVLSESLKYATRQGYLGNNPCGMVDPPKPRKPQMRTMTPDEVEKLLLVAADSFHYPIIYVALNTGLRQAELLGLRWRDVDLDLMGISVSQVLYKSGVKAQFKQPKTAHSRRRVAMTPKLAVFLREYKAHRELLYSQGDHSLSIDDLLFTTYQGLPLNNGVVSHVFHKLALKAGVVGVRFHDMRHTFASLMLLRGAKPKVISEALGHASVAFTMDVYSHIIDGMQEEAMSLLDGVMPSGVSPKIWANGTQMGHGK